MSTADPALAPDHDHSRRPRLIARIALAVVLAIGAVITGIVVSGSATEAERSQVQSSCGDWMDSSSADAQPDAQWCTDLLAWMGEQSGGSMMGTMMWQGSAKMGRACRAWAAEERADTAGSGPRRCDSMVEWMDGHLASGDGRWMRRDR